MDGYSKKEWERIMEMQTECVCDICIKNKNCELQDKIIEQVKLKNPKASRRFEMKECPELVEKPNLSDFIT